MRLIDADVTRDDFMNAVYAECLEDEDNIRANRIIDAFDDLPTTDAEPVRHGKWLRDRVPTLTKLFSCSECKELIALGAYAYKCYYDYCPNCGAKMDEDKNICG